MRLDALYRLCYNWFLKFPDIEKLMTQFNIYLGKDKDDLLIALKDAVETAVPEQHGGQRGSKFSYVFQQLAKLAASGKSGSDIVAQHFSAMIDEYARVS